MFQNKIRIAVAFAAFSLPAFSQYTVNGRGGIIPATGTGGGGNYTTTLPTSFNTFPLISPVPAGASNIRSVTVQNLMHTYIGDLHVVLWNPGMTAGYNLIVRCGLGPPNTCCGYGIDVNGTFTFVPAGDPSINQSWPTVAPTTTMTGGTYPQESGALWGGGWVNGSANVFNTDLASIPVVPGIWNLVIYDGAAADVGTITGWTMTGDSGPAPNVYCSGDGTGTPCPCANSGAAGNGCASSVSPTGAHLASTGSALISNDTLALVGTLMPNSSALYFQGTVKVNGGNGAQFGDGLRCAGGTVIRLGTRINAAGTSQYPGAGGIPIHIKGSVAAGNTRDYQVWYRNAAAYCNPETYNLTNALELTWAP
jgi:hypothetical protein